MYRRLLVCLCKLLIKLLRSVGKNGSALPGLIIERLYPNFLTKSLSSVESKIILVTGTNGKTTTTKMLVAGLRGTGAKVVTNATGSNMTRGLIAALIEDMTYFGSLKPTDWFVFEVDEAYAPVFTEKLSPQFVLALNVLRDQLDRYGEIDRTADLIRQAGSKSQYFIYNELDPLLSTVAAQLRENAVNTRSFGVTTNLLSRVANEQTVHGHELLTEKTPTKTELTAVKETTDGQIVSVRSQGDVLEIKIPVKGFHNALNFTAVVALLEEIAPEPFNKAQEAIANMPIPFGRGERLHIKDKSITVALVKNPSGFATNLATFVKDTKPEAIIFVVNDRLADGRDVSWLWDVQFKNVVPYTSKIFTSGIRAYDMAVRLKHDDIESETITSVTKMTHAMMKSKYKNVVIIPTYTALFEVRAALAKYGKVPRIW